MGCGASSAAGDKAIVTSTRIDPPDSQPASQKPVEEPSAGTLEAKEQSKDQVESEKSSKESHNPPPDVSASAQAKAPSQTEPKVPSKPPQSDEVKQDEVKPAETTKLAPKEASDQDGPEFVGANSEEKPAEGAQVSIYMVAFMFKFAWTSEVESGSAIWDW